MRIVAIIPARMASTRFPGKPLVKIHGHSMIEHVYCRTKCSKLINEVYIATCDHEIADEVKRFRGKSIMTSPNHVRGTDRVAEAAKKIDADLIINVQGDEPTVDPGILDDAIIHMRKKKEIQCLTLISHIKEWDHFVNKDIVKVTFDKEKKILYFSRQPIPTYSSNNFKIAHKQIGIYLIHKDLLLKFAQWNETPLEKIEKVDLLRFLENGCSVYSFLGKDMISVDNPEDLSFVELTLSRDPLFLILFKQIDKS